MGKFFDKDGNLVEVAGVDEAQAVAGNGAVAVVGPDGWRGTIAPSDLPGALADGYRLESPDEHAARRAEVIHGGTGGQVRAGLEGLARGATFGLSDVVQVGLGRDDFERQDFREGLRGRREANPVTSTVGEVAGSLLGPGKGVSKLGAGAAERVAGTQLIKGLATRGAVGKLAADALPRMAGMGLEGVLYGTGSGVTELALSDDPLAADTILATLGSHALYGGGFGLGAGALTSVLGKATAAARDSLRKVSATAARPAEAAAGVADDIAAMDRPALRQAIKAEETASKVRIRQEAAEVIDEVRAAHKGLRDVVDDSLKIDPPVTDAGKKAVRQLRSAAEKLDDRLSAATLAKKPDEVLNLLEKYETALNATGRGVKGDAMEKALERVKAVRTKVEGMSVPSQRMQALRAAREGLDMAPPPAAKGGLAEQAIDKVKGVVASQIGGIGLAAGAAIGAEFDAPWLGAVAGGLAGGALSKLVNGVLRQHAVKAAAAVAEGLDVVLKVAPKAAPVAIPTGNAVLQRTVFGPAETARGTSEGDAFSQRAAEISAAVGNEEATRKVLRERFEGVRAVDLALGQKLEEGAIRRLAYLYDKMPKAPPGVEGWKPSVAEREGWGRRIDAADRPVDAIKRVAHGVATPDEIEALDATAPDLMAAVRKAVFARLASQEGAQPSLALQMLLGPRAPRVRLMGAIQKMHREAAAAAAQTPQRPSALSRRPGEPPTMAQKIGGAT